MSFKQNLIELLLIKEMDDILFETHSELIYIGPNKVIKPSISTDGSLTEKFNITHFV